MKRVLITGATGFIGGRLAEVLSEQSVEVVCPVRHWGRVSRLARLPVRMMEGNVLDRDSIRRAMSGCDVVVHCAADFRATGRAHIRASARGTANVMQAALELGVTRVVHLSSAAVHGLSPSALASPTEESPLRRTGHDYCDGKIAAERIALRYHREHGLPVSILRPTVVYGPFGYYSEAVARVARQGHLVLVDGAMGVCNCLYVDNLIQAILLAATRREAVGEIFSVSDERPVTWREYLERHAGALGPGFTPLPILSREELRTARRRLRNEAVGVLLRAPLDALGHLRDPVIRQGIMLVPGVERLGSVARTLLHFLPNSVQEAVHGVLARAGRTKGSGVSASAKLRRLLSATEEESFSVFQNVTFRIDKAKKLLGYSPAVGFEEGMTRTEAWIRWTRI